MSERNVRIGNTGHGKTAQSQREMDAWLRAHPYKQAWVFDTKQRKFTEKRWFEPHKQIPERKES